jgi:glycine cleavage system aminomethyltransferase T
MRPPIRRSPSARLVAAAGAVHVEEAGWELPASFGDDEAEREAIRGSVALADVSARAKVDLRGEVPSVLPAAAGAVVASISDDWALVFGGPGGEARLLPALEAAAGSTTMVTDATHTYAGFALAGPRIAEVLARTTSWDGDRLGRGEAAAAPIAEIPSVVVRRDLDPRVLEIYVASELGRYAWESLLGVVRRLGGRPVGWQALLAEGWS